MWTGPGRPVLRDMKRLAHDAREVTHIFDQVIVFGDRDA